MRSNVGLVHSHPQGSARSGLHSLRRLCLTTVLVLALATIAAADTVKPMPTPRGAFGVVTATNGRIYAIGGVYGANVVEEYDPPTDTWATKTPIPTGRAYPGVVAASNGRIYVIGGWASWGWHTQANEEYDPLSDAWVSRAPIPTARYDFGVAEGIDGKLYAIGGNYYPTTALNYVEAYDPITNTWEIRTPMPTKRMSGATVAASDGKIYVFGGYDGAGGYLTTVEAYDPIADSWTTKAPMPTRRRGPGAVQAPNGKIYVIGGDQNETIYLPTVEVYDPVTDSWASDTPMPTGRGWHGEALVNGMVYVIGGYDGTSFTGSVDTKSASLRLPAPITAHAPVSAGTTVDFTVSATDLYDKVVPVVCMPASGATFPVGTTTVECSALDERGHHEDGSFTVTVLHEPSSDTTPPVLTVPTGVIGEATSAAGAIVAYSASALDDVDGTVPVTCSPASDSTFPIGTTTVTCSSHDNAGNTATGSFTVTISKAAATVTLSNLSQTYTGSPLTPTIATNPAGLTITWTGAPQTNAGSYPVTATVTGANYQGSASGTFTISKAAATVTLGNLTQTYTGGPLTPTATTNPLGLTVAWTGAPQTNAGNYPVTATVTDANYQGSASETFTISKAAATVTLGNLTQTYTGGPLTPTATTNPLGLTVAWTGAPQTNAGSYSVTATVTNASFQGSASGTFTISKANQAPVAVNDAYSTQWNTVLLIAPKGVLLNDSDKDSDPLSAIKVTNPTHGTVTQDASGGFTYMPTANYSGLDSFTYKANDGTLDSNVGTVTITIISPCRSDDDDRDAMPGREGTGDGDDRDRGNNRRDRDDRGKTDWDGCRPGTPNSHSDQYQTLKNKALTVNPRGVLKNDGLFAATAELLTVSLHGTVTLAANGGFVYAPAANFVGTDVFYYVPRSAAGVAGAVTSVTIAVSAHYDGDGDDHDRKRNGHHDGDGCEHDRARRGGSNDDNDRR